MNGSLRVFLAGLLMLCLAPAFAASLEITPVTVDLNANQNGQVLRLRNSGTDALNAQVRIYAWEQVDGDDSLTPTRDLIASPPIAQVPPGGEQIVRLMRTSQTAASREMAYRLLVDELPAANANAGNGVQFRFRYLVPVFVHPAGEPGAPDTHWSLEQRDGKWLLRVSNSGSMRARISDVTLSSEGSTIPVHNGLLGYALAGRVRDFAIARLPDGWRGDKTTVNVTANVNGKSVTAPVTLKH